MTITEEQLQEIEALHQRYQVYLDLTSFEGSAKERLVLAYRERWFVLTLEYNTRDAGWATVAQGSTVEALILAYTAVVQHVEDDNIPDLLRWREAEGLE